MARKNTLNNFAMFGTAGANMATATTTSSSTQIQNQDNGGIVLSWSGSTPVGAVTIEISNDQLIWVALDFGATIDISGNSGTHELVLNQLPFSWIRAKYTKGSGTGTIFASLTLKQIGG